jgi:hypothetical protein
MASSRLSGVYFYGTQNTPGSDTFIMKSDANLDVIWAKVYPMEQTSPYGFEVSSNDNYCIFVTISDSKLTVVKVNANNGSTSGKWMNGSIGAPISKIYVSLSPDASSLFFTATSPNALI